jgi:predicted SAM-dependent methyltransferase
MQKKYAIDLNEEIKMYAGKDVIAVVADGSNLELFPPGYFDKVFMSNFLEHLTSKKELLKVIEEVYRVTKEKGSIIIMSPNILYTKQHYWDFLDHNIPLSHNTIKELLQLFNFEIKLMRAKFLPYTILSKFPINSILLKTYLRVPLLWHFFGKQMLIIAQK